MDLFDLCEKGNHFYKLKEYDRALYYYDLALNKGYDGLQIIKRAQRLKEMGVVPKPAINVGRARRLVRIRQEAHKQFVFIKANYPDVLVVSLKKLITCTLDADKYAVEQEGKEILFKKDGKPMMSFIMKDENNLRVTFQYFWEMEKYYKTTIVDGKKIKMPAKRRRYHFVIVYDSFTDLLIQLKRITLFNQTYYEEHREELIRYLKEEFSTYKQPEIRILPIEFTLWLETFSVLHDLHKKHSDVLEYDYLKEYIMDTLDYNLKLLEKDPIYKIDILYIMIVFLEKLYETFPMQEKDKYQFIYDKYIPCKKFNEIYTQLFKDFSATLINEPMLHEFTKSLKPFRANLFK